MIRNLLILVCSLSIVSCQKNESVDLLTNGTWILVNGLTSTMKESVKFKTDKTYIIESRVTITRFNDYISGTISGDWSRQDDDILFINSIVNLPDDTSSINIIPTSTGTAIGAFYGYIVSGIYQNDSSLIDDSGSIHFNKINETDIFIDENSNQRKWIIIKLTGDSLIVDSEGKVLKYHNE